MRTGRIVLILVGLALVGLVAYVLLTPSALDPFRSTKTINVKAQIDKLTIAFVGAPYPDDYNVLRLPGWIDNKSKQKFRSATVQIQLLDEKGAKKEKITYDVENLDPQTRTTFDINAGTLPATYKAEIQVTKVEVIQ